MVQTKTVMNNTIWYDDRYTNRWLDAVGLGVYKYIAESVPTDDTTGDFTRFTTTVTEAGGGGNSTSANSTTAGENFLLTTDNAEYDGLNLQIKGEAVKLSADRTVYFRADIEINDADQTDILVGLAETKTDLLNTATSHAVKAASVGVWFVSLDEATTVNFNTQTGGAVTNTSAATVALADATKMALEIYWDGATLYGYQNNTLVGSFTASLPTGDLTLSVNFRTGETTANTCKISNMRLIQAQRV